MVDYLTCGCQYNKKGWDLCYYHFLELKCVKEMSKNG